MNDLDVMRSIGIRVGGHLGTHPIAAFRVTASQFFLGQALAAQYLDEPFNSLASCTDNTGWSFGLDLNPGLDGEAAHIHELDDEEGGGYQSGGHYIRQVEDISGWYGTMYLELDWRAKSTYSRSTVTNARVLLRNP